MATKKTYVSVSDKEINDFYNDLFLIVEKHTNRKEPTHALTLLHLTTAFFVSNAILNINDSTVDSMTVSDIKKRLFTDIENHLKEYIH